MTCKLHQPAIGMTVTFHSYEVCKPYPNWTPLSLNINKTYHTYIDENACVVLVPCQRSMDWREKLNRTNSNCPALLYWVKWICEQRLIPIVLVQHSQVWSLSYCIIPKGCRIGFWWVLLYCTCMTMHYTPFIVVPFLHTVADTPGLIISICLTSGS